VEDDAEERVLVPAGRFDIKHLPGVVVKQTNCGGMHDEGRLSHKV